jgi:general secretion pathway protein I
MNRYRCVEPASAPGDAGFTLVEGLVALAVFALAGIGLVQLQTYSVATLNRVEARALAGIVVQNVLVEAIASEQTPELGAIAGETELGAHRWRWRRIVERTADDGVLRVTVTASRAKAAEEPLTLHAFRVVAAE